METLQTRTDITGNVADVLLPPSPCTWSWCATAATYIQPPPAPQLTSWMRSHAPCSSAVARSMPSVAISDHTAPQKPKAHISCISHPNCLLQEDHVRCRHRLQGSICVLLPQGRQAAFRYGRTKTRIVSCGTNLLCNLRWNVAGVAWSLHSLALLVFTVQSPGVCKVITVCHKGPCEWRRGEAHGFFKSYSNK